MAAAVAKKNSALLNIRDAAAHLKVSQRTVIRLIEAHSLIAVDVSGGRSERYRSLRITPEEVQRFLGANATHKPDNDD